jgi:hypothetical protein
MNSPDSPIHCSIRQAEGLPCRPRLYVRSYVNLNIVYPRCALGLTGAVLTGGVIPFDACMHVFPASCCHIVSEDVRSQNLHTGDWWRAKSPHCLIRLSLDER